MKEVTKEDFFSALQSEEIKGNDIMPHIDNECIYPYTSTWKEKRSTNIFGKTIDGNGIGEGKKYFIK